MKSLLSLTAVTGALTISSLMGASSDNPLSGADSQFATKAAAGGIAEVKLGELAQKNASSPDVKAFGQKMVDDHTKAGNKLKSIVSKSNMNVAGLDGFERPSRLRQALQVTRSRFRSGLYEGHGKRPQN